MQLGHEVSFAIFHMYAHKNSQAHTLHQPRHTCTPLLYINRSKLTNTLTKPFASVSLSLFSFLTHTQFFYTD